ncbi:MAG: hypothetical protein AAF362_09095 [Pseudomonadota bacterium]
METGVLIALGFGVAIIFLAILLTRLFSRQRSNSRHDHEKHGGGRAEATWAGIKQAQRDIDHD